MPEIVVAGSRTEALENIAPKRAVVKGFVSQSELKELLVRAKCLSGTPTPDNGAVDADIRGDFPRYTRGREPVGGAGFRGL